MNSPPAEIEPKISLVSEDGLEFKVDKKCALQIGIIQAMPGQTSAEEALSPVPLPSIKSTILSKIIEFLEQHKDDAPAAQTGEAARETDESSNSSSDEAPAMEDLCLDSHDASSAEESSDDFMHEEYLAAVTPWDQRYFESMDLLTLLEVTKAANYLYIPLLLDLCCRTIAKQMTGLKAEEIRKKFNLPDDFTPEEESRLAAEFAWIEE